MACNSIFPTATEARQNPIRETVIHQEICAIQSAILNSIKNGLFQATVSSGSPMTGLAYTNIVVDSINLANDQLLVPNHPFKTGDIITVSSNQTLPAPLKSTEYYVVIYIDADHIKLAQSIVDAFESRPISIDFTVGVTNIVLTNPGSGYLSAPRVAIDLSSNGSSATATASLATWGSIDSITTLSNGSGYVDIPTISIVSQGSGAVVNVIKFNAVGISIASSGSNYRVGDVLSVVGGVGTATTATVTSITSNGGVATISLKTPGLYTSLPNLAGVATTALPGGGSGCTVNLTMGIGSLGIDPLIPGGSYGTGYVAPPVVTISGGNGTGAQAEALISTGSVTGFRMINYGSGYTSSPTVTIDSGSGAVASAVLQPSSVGNVTVTFSGGDIYQSEPVVIVESVGSGATAGVITMKIVNAVMSSSGSGYTVGDILLIAGGVGTKNASIMVTKVGTLGEITNYSLITSGSYNSLPVLSYNSVSGGTGRSATFNLTAGVDSISVSSPGLGYNTPPLVIITPPDNNGSGAVAHAKLLYDEVSRIEVIDSGVGYTSIPTVSITSGAGAILEAVLVPTGIFDIIPTEFGSGYTVENTYLEIIGTGTGVEYTLDIGPLGSIDGITITNPGTGFTKVPIVNVIGDGVGAVVQAVLVNTSIDTINVINGGTNYTCPPVITVEFGASSAVARLTPTGIDRIDVLGGGINYTSSPTIYTIPSALQQEVPISPSARANIGYSLNQITVTFAGSGYDTIPNVNIDPPGNNGIPATALAYIGAGVGIMVVSNYPDSRDYYKVWKNQTPSDPIFVRPYTERMDTVIAYFTGLGYTITRQTNPATNNTIQWSILW